MRGIKKPWLFSTTILLISVIFIFQSVSAMLVVSPDYKGSWLGTGMATSNPSSNSDISVEIRNTRFAENTTLVFDVDLIERVAEEADMYIDYSVINQEQYQIFTKIEDKTVQGNLSYEKEIAGVGFTDGDYLLVVSAIYGNARKAFVVQRFRVKDGTIELLPWGSLRYYLYVYKFWIALGAVLLALLIALPPFIKFLDHEYHRKSVRFKHVAKKKLFIPVSVNMIDSFYNRKH